MTDQQDAVERLRKIYHRPLPANLDTQANWEAVGTLHNALGNALDALESQRSRLETCQQENERLLRAVEEVIKHDGEFDPRGGYFHDAEVPQHKMDELINAYHEVQEARNA